MWAGWDTELNAYPAELKKAKPKRAKTFAADEKTMEDECKKGYARMGIRPKSATAPTETNWSVLSLSRLLEASATRQLKVVKATKHTGQTLFLHAEQSLLFSYAEHLRLGGTAFDLHVAGQKPPCAACSPVIKAFGDAYGEVYGRLLHSDKNTDQEATEKKNSGTLTMTEPASTQAGTDYTRVAAHYKELIAA